MEEESFATHGWRRKFASWPQRFADDYDALAPIVVSQAAVASKAHGKQAKSGDTADDPGATGTSVWDGSVALAAALLHPGGEAWRRVTAALGGAAPTRALELGSGTGLAGLAAAATGRLQRVTLSELPAVVPFMAANAARNLGATTQAGCEVVCEALVWGGGGEVLGAAAALRCELVLGGDLMYRDDAVQPLLATLAACVGPGGCALLALDLDHSDTAVPSLLAGAEKVFEVERLLGEEVAHPEYSSESICFVLLTRRKDQVVKRKKKMLSKTPSSSR